MENASQFAAQAFIKMEISVGPAIHFVQNAKAHNLLIV